MGRIHLSKAHVTEIEEQLVLEAMRSGWVAPLGPMVDRFEAEVAAYIGVAGAVALSSGTAALHLALLEAGARTGRIVVLPSMTFAASANAVLYTGAQPVFVDSGEDANVDVGLLIETVRRLSAEGCDVAAVMTVDLFGRCADYTVLVHELDTLGIPLIEDAAEALGARHAGRSAGSFGQAAGLSFNGNKIMTTSGGGMLVSNNLDLLARARYLATQARQPAPWYEHTEMGFNYRMSNILAAIGVGQLSRLDDMIAMRRAHRDHYASAFGNLPGVDLLGGAEDAGDNCWLTCVLFDPQVAKVTPEEVVSRLEDLDIEARHLWKPMHLQPLYSKARMFENGMSAQLFRRGVTLPSGSELSEADIDRVIRAVIQVVGSPAA